MRVWDIDPGFLNTPSLLGEHRELHAVYTVITQNKRGYARHPETLRWVDHLDALSFRHALLVSEMRFRGFNHKSPIKNDPAPARVQWPKIFIDPPCEQFEILRQKYKDKPQGRIPLPKNISDLWAAHKYSVMARDLKAYKNFGKRVADKAVSFDELADSLAFFLRNVPPKVRMKNSLQHMWGYLNKKPAVELNNLDNKSLLNLVREKTIKENITYLKHSTAPGELLCWCGPIEKKGENNDGSSHT